MRWKSTLVKSLFIGSPFIGPSCIGLAIGGLLCAMVAGAAADRTPTRSARAFELEGIEWSNSPIECVQVAVLTGDPKTEMHHSYVKMSSGCVIPPHWHTTDEYVTVVSGDTYLGIGESIDRDSAKQYGPGSFVFIPAQTPHYGWSDGGCVLSQTRSGAVDFHWLEQPGDAREPE